MAGHRPGSVGAIRHRRQGEGEIGPPARETALRRRALDDSRAARRALQLKGQGRRESVPIYSWVRARPDGRLGTAVRSHRDLKRSRPLAEAETPPDGEDGRASAVRSPSRLR